MTRTALQWLSLGARDAVFAPLAQSGRAELVAQRLADAIALGLLRHEEQLPSESELAARFGVATVTVREALTALRHQGLVSTRRGRAGGSFVQTPPDPSAGLLRNRLANLSLGDLRDLCDHYAAISGAAARLAADRGSPEDAERVRARAQALTVAEDPGDRRRAECAFHVEVAAAAQSPRLTREEIRLQAEIGWVLWLPYADAAAHERGVEQHRALTKAIAAGDCDQARVLAEEHVAENLRDAVRTYRRLTRSR